MKKTTTLSQTITRAFSTDGETTDSQEHIQLDIETVEEPAPPPPFIVNVQSEPFRGPFLAYR